MSDPRVFALLAFTAAVFAAVRCLEGQWPRLWRELRYKAAWWRKVAADRRGERTRRWETTR